MTQMAEYSMLKKIIAFCLLEFITIGLQVGDMPTNYTKYCI